MFREINIIISFSVFMFFHKLIMALETQHKMYDFLDKKKALKKVEFYIEINFKY